MDIKKRPGVFAGLLFLVCFIVRHIELLLFRTDETLLAGPLVSQLFGLAVLTVAVRRAGLTWKNIGFLPDKFVRGSMIGLSLGASTFAAAYAIEFLILRAQGLSPVFRVYSAAADPLKSGLFNAVFAFLLPCLLFNLIGAVMEEGLFRGLFITSTREKYGFARANLLTALLFGLWHWIIPLRSFFDGETTFAPTAVFAVGYAVLTGLMSLRWGLLLNISGYLWIGVAEHFLNNFILNILHVETAGGTDSLLSLRSLTVQLISLGAVLAYAHIRQKKSVR